MIIIDRIKVYNIANAIYSARNPLNSWEKSDSDLEKDSIGDNDLDLMKRLYKAGTEHRKYLRQIFVSMDITAPLYWIAELDTYKIGTTRNSCSFMHKGISKPFDDSDFDNHSDEIQPQVWGDLLNELNRLRDVYLETGDPQIFQTIRDLLPSGYLQKFTITMNYENVVNIINQRKHHRLVEWRRFCDIMLEELPYLKEIISDDKQ